MYNGSMTTRLSRRDFLTLSALSAGAMAFRPPAPGPARRGGQLVRVASDWIGLYAEPSFSSSRLAQIERDSLMTVLETINADDGPGYNPLWYRVADGYAHSGHLQTVRWEPQAPIQSIPGGALFEISVPYTRTYRRPDSSSDPLYRLYFSATAWVEKSVEGADGRRWYQLVDDLLHVRYYARAEHLRMVPAKELTPISPEIPLSHKRIEVSLARQELLAFEDDQLVLRTRISSGIPDLRPPENGIPTITPTGRFYVDKKMPLRHMGDGKLTASLDAYELPGVPWVSFFHETGVAFHGTYWHTNFGTPMSHGCVNMQVDEARWLFRWTLPVVKHDEILKIGRGTPVLIT
jgi:hypothetical protein